ncbi:MAG: YbaL family putative K(+) efflux transporter [Alphaproteobacteria bacterium]
MAATPLIATLVTAFLLAFVLATVAARFKVSPIVGYLLAGIACGPFTPGFVADQHIAAELAEVGVVLLMFGVGLHFSVKELLSVRGVALPGALAGISVLTLLGAGLGALLGWTTGASVIFGLCLSVASTVVVLRSLEERRQLQTERGRLLIGWLVVEDTAMVLALVLVPALAGIGAGDGSETFGQIGFALALTLGRVAAFAALMLIVGRRVIPAILHYVAHTGNRELFRLAVLALSLGIAFGAAAIFGVTFALGAFFAGLVLAESTLSQSAARETLPLRDAFSVLFFVSVGMLFDPSIVWRQPLPVLATVVVIIGGKALVAFGVTRALGCAAQTSRYMAASLAQIGEFSFILAGLGLSLGLISTETRDLVLAGSIFSILLNPFGFLAIGRWETGKVVARGAAAAAPEPVAPPKHAAVIGYGRVGSAICAALSRRRVPVTVIEIEEIDAAGVPAGVKIVRGNAANPAILRHADLANAECLYVAVPDGFEAAEIVEEAKRANPTLRIVARVNSRYDADHLKSLGVDRIVVGEEELAKGMVAAALTMRPDPAA